MKLQDNIELDRLAVGSHLAIDGGAKEVVSRYPTRRMRLAAGIRLSADVLKMLPWAAFGTTTITDGSGIIRKFESAFCVT